MKFLDKLREMPRKKLVNRVILLVILIYSIVFTSLIFSLSISLFKIIGGIRIPENLIISLVPESPLLRASYSVSNDGFSDVSNIIIDFKVDINYFEMDNDTETRADLFFKSEGINRINPWQNYEAFIEGGSEYFDISNLQYFWNNANLSKPFYYILNINITGKYCLGIIPFRINIKNLNPDCPTCG
jgi:hypothetical protein